MCNIAIKRACCVSYSVIKYAPRQHRVISSVGRASALQAECRRFDSVITHQYFFLLISDLIKFLVVSELFVCFFLYAIKLSVLVAFMADNQFMIFRRLLLGICNKKPLVINAHSQLICICLYMLKIFHLAQFAN